MTTPDPTAITTFCRAIMRPGDVHEVRILADVSASDGEVAQAIARRDAIRQYLADEHGWPEPVVESQSGNGGALVYGVDLPNDAPRPPTSCSACSRRSMRSSPTPPSRST